MAHGAPDEPVGKVEEKRPKAPVGSRRIFPPQFKLQVNRCLFLYYFFHRHSRHSYFTRSTVLTLPPHPPPIAPVRSHDRPSGRRRLGPFDFTGFYAPYVVVVVVVRVPCQNEIKIRRCARPSVLSSCSRRLSIRLVLSASVRLYVMPLCNAA